MPSEIVEDPVLKHRLRFERTTDEHGAEVVHCEMWVDPGGGVPAHVHPSMEERFTVLEGRAEFLSGRRWIGAGAGETVVVPAGTRHAYRNRGSEVAHVMCVASPPDPGLEAFLTEAAAMARAGKITKLGLPKSPSALLQAMAMVHRNRDMVTMGFPPLPPQPLQGWLVKPLAKLGERRGYGTGQLG
jgi:quercetin dioxygenase-like cupin family protein